MNIKTLMRMSSYFLSTLPIITIFSFAISIPLGLTLSFLFIMYQILKRGSGTGGFKYDNSSNPPADLD